LVRPSSAATSGRIVCDAIVPRPGAGEQQPPDRAAVPTLTFPARREKVLLDHYRGKVPAAHQLVP